MGINKTPYRRTAHGWKLTRHAQKRCQQRQLDLEAIDLVIAYGREKRVNGASRWFLDKTARERMKQDLGCKVYTALGQSLSLTVVQADNGDLITSYRRKPRRRFSFASEPIMAHYFHIVSGRFLSRGAWLAIAEATIVYKCALDDMSVDPIADRLAEGIVYESQSVLKPLVGRAGVIDYLRGKFETLARSDVEYRFEPGVVDLPAARSWPCLIVCRDGVREGLIVLKLDRSGKISRVDLLTIVPRAQQARVANLADQRH